MSDKIEDEAVPRPRTSGLSERQKKFVREVGSVVLGVLIALAAAEAAEWVRWQWRIAAGSEAMRAELSGNRFNVAERRAYHSCVSKRLAELGAILAEARRTHRLPDIGKIGDPGRRPTETAAFDAATGEGVLLRMPRTDARDFAIIYRMASYFDQEALAEIQPWATLALMERAPGPVDGDLLATLLDAWAQAQTRARWTGLIAEQTDEALKASGIPIDERPAGATWESLVGEVTKRNLLCAPLIMDGKPYGKPE